MNCTRKNPVHFTEESHPKSHSLAAGGGGGPAKSNEGDWVPVGKTKCQFGMGCTRKNPAHFQDTAHPRAHSMSFDAGGGVNDSGGEAIEGAAQE